MMKAKLLLLLFCFCAVGAMGQGVVTRNKCKTCGKVLSKCVCNKKKPTPKPKPKPTPKPQSASEEAGYDVTFACNVSSANLYVDGNANGTASGSHFLKTGQHTIQVMANGYKDYTRVITVNRQNRSFYIELEKKPMTNRTFRVGNVEFAMVKVDGGTFTMGATAEMSEPYDWEKPTHQVTLSSYSIGETEVTQALWQAVMGNNPSHFKGDNLPVEQVSWDDCRTFINKLNDLTGQRFRLPTEAEWGFAARGGNRSNHTQYSGGSSIDEVAWYTSNSGSKTHPVKTKKPNELGIYDMTGNVWEWCQDWFGSYSSSSQYNPEGPSSGWSRVGRGGGWRCKPRDCRSSCRGYGSPGYRHNDLGLRLALSE